MSAVLSKPLKIMDGQSLEKILLLSWLEPLESILLDCFQTLSPHLTLTKRKNNKIKANNKRKIPKMERWMMWAYLSPNQALIRPWWSTLSSLKASKSQTSLFHKVTNLQRSTELTSTTQMLILVQRCRLFLTNCLMLFTVSWSKSAR